MPSTPLLGSTSKNDLVDAIQWGGWRWADGGTPGTNITYYFDEGGTSLSSFGTSVAWLDYQKQGYELALQQWANVANITFTEVTSYPAADLVEHVYSNPSSGILGVHETPQHAYQTDGTAWGAYNTAGPGWDPAGLQSGGFALAVVLHEIGHALGLAHPHDTGGGSSRFPGVISSGSLGSDALNQGIFTVMSYNDGWKTGLGLSPSDDYGWTAGPMAFDIAAIQQLYGANTSFHTGDDTYVLRHVDGEPDGLIAIWDAGGTDEIVYGGDFTAIIDLRAATLKEAPGGGGFVSFAKGAPASDQDHWNAFTIANGVVIENATGGSGGDTIIGNHVKNRLDGLDGNDLLSGFSGGDTLLGGAGWDTLIGGAGADILDGGADNDILKGISGRDTLIGGEGRDTLTGGRHKDFLLGGSERDLFDFNGIGDSRNASNRDVIYDFERGLDAIDLRTIDAKIGVAGNNAFKWIGTGAFHDVKGELRYKDLGSQSLVQGDVNGDGRADFSILVKVGALNQDDFLL